MHPERAPIPEELLPDSTERTDSANDNNGPERKRSPEFKIDENREGETPEEDGALKEKEPTFEELALGIAMEKHGGRADEWKPNNDFAEWNKHYIREDGEIVDHRGIPVMESAMKDPKGTESVEFKRFVEVQEYLKNEANIGVPIYSGDYVRVENGKEIYQVTSVVRRENGEIEYMPLDYTKELAEENDDTEENGAEETLQGKTEDKRAGEEEISIPFVTIEDDGSMNIDLTAALEAELEEVIEEDEVPVATNSQLVTSPAQVFMIEQKVLAQEVAPQALAFKALEAESPAQGVFPAEAIERTSEVPRQEVVSGMPAQPLAEIKENELPRTLQTESIAIDYASEVLQKESIVLEVSTIAKPKLARQEESISVVSVEEIIPKQAISLIEAESIPFVSDEITKEQIEQIEQIEHKNQVLLAATQDVLKEKVLGNEAIRPQVQELKKESVWETMISESFVESTTSMETIQSTQSEARENIKVEEKYIEFKESIPVKEEVVVKIIEEKKQEKFEAEIKLSATEQEELKIISEGRNEKVLEFIPVLSRDESNSRSKESPFVVHENELQLRETTERMVSVQELERTLAGIPDDSMSPANAAVAANDNTEETRVSAPVTSQEVTQNGITLNLRDAA